MRGQNGFRDQSALNECGFAAAPEGACDGEMAASGSGNQQVILVGCWRPGRDV
jgi:hypothetical protein